MIKSIRDRETDRIFSREQSRKFSAEIGRRELRKLLILDAAVTLNDLKTPPGNRLEALKGKRKGRYSIRVNDQWRICFIWKDGNAFDVEITDYHS